MRRLTSPERPLLVRPCERTNCFVEPVDCHQEHEINVALRGAAIYRLADGGAMDVVAGDIVALPAGSLHGVEVPQAFATRIFHFHPSIYERLADAEPACRLVARLRTWDDPPPVRKIVSPDRYLALGDLYEHVSLEQTRTDPLAAAVTARLAELVALSFLRVYDSPESAAATDRASQRALSVRAWIDRHFAEDCSLPELARMAHFSPSHFSAVFRRTVGLSPIAYVKRCRLDHARLLLAQSDQSVHEIAFSVGFRQIEHFDHMFKADMKMTPSQYRKKAQSLVTPRVGG